MKDFKRVAGVVLASFILMGAVYLPVNVAARTAYVQCPECGADAIYEKVSEKLYEVKTEVVPCEHGFGNGYDEITTTYRITAILECTDLACGYYETVSEIVSEEVVCCGEG